MSGIGPELLDALAADLRSDGELLPCTVLRRLISPPARRTAVSPELIEQATLLASACFSFALALREDLGGLSPIPDFTSGAAATRRQLPAQIEAGRLGLLTEGRQEKVVFPIATHRFLNELPEAFVHDLVRWASPVVSPLPGNGPVPILGNLIPALIAKHRIPKQSVWCRVLIDPVSQTYSTTQIAMAAIIYLGPICKGRRDLIIGAAPSVSAAMALTGVGRSRCSEIRQAQKMRQARKMPWAT